MTVLDGLGVRYGARPSMLIGETDPAKAFSIDYHAARWGIFADKIAHRNAGKRTR